MQIMINSTENCIFVSGAFTVSEFHRLLAAIHNRVAKQGYEELTLDFEGCSAAFSGPMLAVCSQASKLRRDRVFMQLKLPLEEKLRRLFINANWAYIIDPLNYAQSTFRGLRQVPTTQFFSSEEQNQAVNSILEIIISSLSGFTREDLAAIEWSLNEITDNVINHSNSEVGGFVQLSTFQRNRKKVEYVVCDAGIGIPTSLRQARSSITSDSDALDHAIREGVTRNTQTNQGNGLFGTFEISRVSEGSLEIHSGYASLTYNKREGLKIRTEQVPFNGTLIIACIDYSNPGLLANALKFGGKPHFPIDFIETKFEDSQGNKFIFVMKNETKSFGSRKAAEPVKIKLANVARICKSQKIFIDFDDIAVISSSFADEVFGKLFVEMGPLAFMQKFEFMNTSDVVRSLIDRSITLRAMTPKREEVLERLTRDPLEKFRIRKDILLEVLSRQPVSEFSSDTSSKIRVYELAHRMGLENKELLARLHALGIEAKSHTTVLNEDDVKKVMARFFLAGEL
jgi:anti-sigma regulatory factor (Ser/Thr protein kinase)